MKIHLDEHLSRQVHNHLKVVGLLFLTTLALGLFSDRSIGQRLNTPELLKRIREAYYNPRKHGLKEMHATVHPQWISMPAGTSAGKLDSANAVFRHVHFVMSIDSNDAITVTHDGDVPTRSYDIVYNAEKGLAGLLQSWEGFVLTIPFDGPDSMYTFTKSGTEYQLIEQERRDTTTIILSSDFAIRKLTMEGEPMQSMELLPHFMKTLEGLLYTGCDATFVASGDMPSIPSTTVTFEYQQFQTFYLPKTIRLTSTINSMQGVMMWSLDEYSVKS